MKVIIFGSCSLSWSKRYSKNTSLILWLWRELEKNYSWIYQWRHLPSATHGSSSHTLCSRQYFLFSPSLPQACTFLPNNGVDVFLDEHAWKGCPGVFFYFFFKFLAKFRVLSLALVTNRDVDRAHVSLVWLSKPPSCPPRSVWCFSAACRIEHLLNL